MGLVLDDVQGGGDGLRWELLQNIVKTSLFTGNVAGTEDRLHLKKTFNRFHGPKGGDFDDSIYGNLLCGRLLRVCREKFCLQARILLGEADITILRARQKKNDTHKKQLLTGHYKVQYPRAMPHQLLAAEQRWRALYDKKRYTEKNAMLTRVMLCTIKTP